MTASTINPVSIVATALRGVRAASDYQELSANTDKAIFAIAWGNLSEADQARVTRIVNDDKPTNPKVIADELSSCGSEAQLEELKAIHGDVLVKAGWKLLPSQERDRLTAICKSQLKETATVPETPTTQQKRTLFSIGDDLERLNELLDQTDGDTEQLTLINEWFSTLGEERDRKLDNYASLISEMTARAAIRKAEGQRMVELAASDELRAKQLKDRLKVFFEAHELKTINTQRYRLSLCNNSSRPLVIDNDIAPKDLPEQYQKVSVEANNTAIRDALKAGEELPFARLGDAGKHIRIK